MFRRASPQALDLDLRALFSPLVHGVDADHASRFCLNGVPCVLCVALTVVDRRAAVPETALSESAVAALASWRGTSTLASRGGGKNGGAVGSSKKALSAQGNNLTKYWGPSLAKKTPQKRESADARGAVGGGGVERSGLVDRNFELGATPDRPLGEARGGGVRERGGFQTGVAGTPGGRGCGDVSEKVRRSFLCLFFVFVSVQRSI